MAFRFCPLCAAALEPLPAEHRDAGRPACPAGHFVHYENPAVTTQAWIERDGRWLLLRRAHEPQAGEWDLPGGFIEPGEDPEDSVRREVREETGLEIEVLGIFAAGASTYGEGGKHTVDIAFRCRSETGEVGVSEEKSEHGWFALGDFPPLAFASENANLERLRTLLG
jgi:ADP-ribose pyrophosphatase YjhB (NUDIX family)